MSYEPSREFHGRINTKRRSFEQLCSLITATRAAAPTRRNAYAGQHRTARLADAGGAADHRLLEPRTGVQVLASVLRDAAQKPAPARPAQDPSALRNAKAVTQLYRRVGLAAVLVHSITTLPHNEAAANHTSGPAPLRPVTLVKGCAQVAAVVTVPALLTATSVARACVGAAGRLVFAMPRGLWRGLSQGNETPQEGGAFVRHWQRAGRFRRMEAFVLFLSRLM